MARIKELDDLYTKVLKFCKQSPENTEICLKDFVFFKEFVRKVVEEEPDVFPSHVRAAVAHTLAKYE